MYISYINDRQKLGFSCLKDIESAKKINIKGKQIFVIIFSTSVAIFIFFRSSSMYIERYQDFRSNEVHSSRVIKSDNLRFLNSPPGISDFILKLKGGSDEEQERLIKSILAKTEQSDLDEISINKFLKRFLEIIDPVISDQRSWRILNEFGKPIKSELLDLSEVQSTNILGKTKSRSSSSIFVEGFSTPPRLSPMQKRVQLKMAQNNFSDNLESSGLSRNHEQLSKNIQFIEKLTKRRRAEPLYPSKVLGESYQYGGKQLERKAPRHLPDFGISIVGKSIEQLGVEYKDLVETILSKQGLVVRKDGTLNKQELTINIGDPETRGIVSFENNPLYDKYHFISSYPVSPEAFEAFKETGNIGMSKEERAQEINKVQRTQAQAERERTTARSFYNTLPEDARIGNQQLREVEAIQEQLKQDPSLSLTEKEKDMLQRAEKYQQYKNKFYQNNPDIDRDDL